jgi:parallel beta-helix repeat protein
MASGTANVYNATVAATPLQVFKDDVRITLGASKAALNDHEWFSSGITLSMRDDTGDPDVQAYVITASVRNYGIYGSGKSYITLNDLITTKANLDGVYFDTYTDNIVDGCTATYSVQAGVQFHSPVGTGGICRNSILAYNGIAGQPVLVGVDMAGTENTIIENNDIYGNYIGLECDQGSSGNIVRYNKIHDNVTTGININNSDSNQVYYNLIYGNGSVSLGAFGISMFDSSSGTCTGNQIYNNTFSDNSYVGIDIRTEQTNLKIKNNIFSQNYGYAAPNAEMWIYSGFTFGGLEIDNNNYYHSDPAADPYWNLRCWWYGTIASLTYKTWAEWKALTIGGINPDASYSLNSDPKVTSTVTPDFHLQPTSPCINAGVNVGLTQDYEGNRTPRGPRPDIGAYEFQPKRGWLLLLFGIK